MNAKMRKAIKDSLDNGMYYFDDDTMRFWNCKIMAGMYDNNMFVTSEDNYNRTRELFTVRQYDWETHNVNTISEFQQFETLSDAMEWLKANS